MFYSLFVLLFLSYLLISEDDICYDSMLKGLSKEQTLVLSDTRELDRVPSTE